MKLGMHINIYGAPWRKGKAPPPPLGKSLRELAAIGYQGVEIPLWRLLDSQRRPLLDIEGVRRSAEDLRLDIFGMGGYTGFTDLERTVRQQGIAEFKENLQLASRLGAGLVITTGGDPAPGSSEEEAIELIAEGLCECLELAKELGIRIALEVDSRLLRNTRNLIAIIDGVSDNQVGALLDTVNLLQLQKNVIGEIEEWPLEAVENLGSRLIHLHFSDYAVGDDGNTAFAYPGEGMIDVEKFFGALDRIGYQGNVTVEYKGQTVEDVAALARKCYQNLKRFLA